MRPNFKKDAGQSIFEYFILTILVVSIALYFLRTTSYQGIKNSTEDAFSQAVEKIANNTS